MKTAPSPRLPPIHLQSQRCRLPLRLRIFQPYFSTRSVHIFKFQRSSSLLTALTAALPRPLAHRNSRAAITHPVSSRQTGAIAHDNLFARQVTLTAATCGYYDGVATSPVTCDTDTGYECGFRPNPTAPNFGCCSSLEGGTTCALGYVSTCIENGARLNTFTGDGVLVDAGNKRFLW